MWSMLRSLAPVARHPGLRLMTPQTVRAMPRHLLGPAIRRLCATAAMDDDMTLCRVLGRYRMFADNRDFGLSPHLMLEGFWEMWVTLALLGAVREGMAAVDVGANLGYFSLLLADIVGPSGRVHACEPNPRAMRLLTRSVALNGYADRVALHAQPLGATSGEPVRLVVPAGEPKNAYLSHAPNAAEADGSAGHDLRTMTLDEIVGGGPVDFIKIDAEGAERDIWRGMRNIVARNDRLTIFMEFTAERYADPGAFLAEFAACGFGVSRIDERRGIVPVTAQQVLAEPGDVDQMLALMR